MKDQTVRINKRLSATFIFLLILALPLSANSKEITIPTHLLVQGGMYSFDATTSSGSSSISGIGAYNFSAGLTLLPRWTLFGSLSLLIADGVSGDSATGYDVGFQYYYMSSSERSIFGTENISFDLVSKLRPYVGMAMRQRQFTSVLSSAYIGPGIFTGLNFQYKDNWYFNGEVRYDMLQGNSDNSATQMNIMLGIGLQL